MKSHSYTYLPNGNISGKQSTVGAQTTNYAYQYDKAGRLTNETINSAPTAYTYDAWGNRASITGNGTSSTYTYDANNRLTKSITEEGTTTTTADYYYDHNGNQITKAVNVTTPQSGVAAYFMSQETNSYLSMYEYDSYNRLKSADTDGSVTTYTYDGNNLRQSKTSNGITTQHIWDGSNMVVDGTNKFYRGATGIEFASLNGNTSFYHKDAHGDVTALTDSAGIITQSYIYDAFGNQINENENDINPFRYCGEYYDLNSNLIYLRNRYYDPAIGRLIAEDSHWDPTNMIYGDDQEAVRYVIVNSNKIYYSENGVVIEYELNRPFEQKKCVNLYSGIGDRESINRITGMSNELDGIVSPIEVSRNDYNSVDKFDVAFYESVRVPNIDAIRQSTNLYTYAINNPIMYYDPTGNSAAAAVMGGATFGPAGAVVAVGVVVVAGIIYLASEHTKGARPSTKGKHEKGQARKQKDAGGEKGDARRTPRKDKKK